MRIKVAKEHLTLGWSIRSMYGSWFGALYGPYGTLSHMLSTRGYILGPQETSCLERH